MGQKGKRRTSQASEAAAAVADRLEVVGPVKPKGMFGGYGLFLEGVMFGLVDSEGTVHLRASEETGPRFIEKGSAKHGRMPYYSVPEDVLADDAQLTAWATQAVEVARAAKR